MAEQKQQIKIAKMKSYLHRVHFQHLHEFASKFKVSLDEDLRHINASNEGFTLVFTRRVSLEPQALFDLEVVYHLECTFDEPSKIFFNGKENVLQDFINRSKERLISSQNIISNSSKLIAELTSYNNKNPLILPAMLKSQSKKKNEESNEIPHNNIIS